jgi:phosphoglucomutase
MKEIFDFPLIKSYLKSNPNFKVLFDALSGVTGPYGVRIFIDELELPESSVQNCESLPDFGGKHPDPNLIYAHSLVEAVDKNGIQFGAASDGDGDRNMIYGANAFVSPGDSLAIIAHHALKIPYFQKNGVLGLARSMPTSGAVDLVAKKKGLECYEVPTGWKFFCNLFDSNKLSICGEESFGTGSNHIREKDGLWAVIAWLNIIAAQAKENPGEEPSIKNIQLDFWKEYGRKFFRTPLTHSRAHRIQVPSSPVTTMRMSTPMALRSSRVTWRPRSPTAPSSAAPSMALRSPMLATSSTRTPLTAAWQRTRDCTSSFRTAVGSWCVCPAPAVRELRSGCTSRSTSR